MKTRKELMRLFEYLNNKEVKFIMVDRTLMNELRDYYEMLYNEYCKVNNEKKQLANIILELYDEYQKICNHLF